MVILVLIKSQDNNKNGFRKSKKKLQVGSDEGRLFKKLCLL